MRTLAVIVSLISVAVQAAVPATITVQADKPDHAIAPTLWGIFFEDINLSADGGIYPELVRNRRDVVLPVEVKVPMTDPGARGGAVGIGTWATQAEFKDIKVVKDGQTLYAAAGTNGWRFRGGDWSIVDGAVRQMSEHDNVRAMFGDKSWNNYTLSLKARKLCGAEGFLVLFRIQGEQGNAWWNIGGWGNARHGIEMEGVDHAGVPGGIEMNKWYDILVEAKGSVVKCYLDDKLVHEATLKPAESVYASASRETSSGDVIVKVVNTAYNAVTADVACTGASKVAGATVIELSSASAEDENSIETPMKVAPKTSKAVVTGGRLQHTFPANSVTVLRLH